MLHPLLTDPLNKSCFFIIDRLGNFSQELLMWMSSEFCTESVRKRLVYIQPGRDDFVSTFNPLEIEESGNKYYRVARTTEVILRAWESVNIEAMPRLARWTHNSFAAAAELGLTVADCVHFVMPGSPHHSKLLDMLPLGLKSEWNEIIKSGGGEATRILESTRNRLKPYFESDILKRMFGSTVNRLDVKRLMAEGRIVIIDLSTRNRLATQLGNTIGSLIINEVLAVARSLPREVKYPTYLLLDEFQNFVGPDLEAALPEVRQLGLRLILSHQSFSQLEKENYDLSSMIFQAQSRMIFGLQGEDADLLAHEVAAIKYDHKRVKDQIYSSRQRVIGHRKEILKSNSAGFTDSSQTGTSRGTAENNSNGESYRGFPADYNPTFNRNRSESRTNNETYSTGAARSTSEGEHESLVPILQDFVELCSRTYESFEEQKMQWAREIRNLRTGESLMRLVDDPNLYRIKVKRSTPGFLQYDIQTLARKLPRVLERMDRMIEENFQSDFFASAETVDREAREHLENVLASRIVINHPRNTQPEGESAFGV